MSTHFARRYAPALAAVMLVLGIASVVGHAQSKPFPVAQLFFELNDTAGDLGIHGEIDGGPWTWLRIEGPGGRQLLSLVSQGRLRTQGMTQLAFESAEPTFDELAPGDFFRRFPQGYYDIEGRAQDGTELESEVYLSHVLAEPPPNITVNGQGAAASCEAMDLPVVAAPLVIDWDPVTRSHPDLGRRGPVQVSRYQFFLELPGGKLSVDLPSTTTEYALPAIAAPPGSVLKFEIIARTATGNNTAVESCFRLQ